MGQESNSGISSDMLASVVEATVQKVMAEASQQRSSSRRSMYSSSSSDSSDSSSSDDDSSSHLKKRNSKKGYTLGNSKQQRSMSSNALSSLASNHASSPALSSMGGGGMGKKTSSRSRSSLSLDKIGEDRPVHRITSEVSLMSGLSIDGSSENKTKTKKKKSKSKKKDKEKKLKKIRSDGSMRSSKSKSKKKSSSKSKSKVTNDDWVPQGPPVDMLTANRRSFTGVSTLATDGYTQELVQHKSHHHQSENGGGALMVKRKSKKFTKEETELNNGALVPMGSQQHHASYNQLQTARQKFDARLAWTFEGSPPVNYDFEQVVHGHFPGAVTNKELVTSVVSTLFNKGYKVGNTLLATSLCCDELARQLEEDFNGVYGNNFNLGGLAGFPFAGNTGFGAMSHHIPDDGYCLIVFGPHVGVAKDGSVGKVERAGIELIDTCCGSAVAASNYVESITNGSKCPTVQIQKFTDFQQSAVQELILPHGKRLVDAGADRMIELPYAIYDSQDMLLSEIINVGSEGLKRGLALLGGIQINTGPDTPDYFHPLRFDYMNYRGEIVDNMLPSFTSSQK